MCNYMFYPHDSHMQIVGLDHFTLTKREMSCSTRVVWARALNVSNTFLLVLSVLLALCGPSPPSSRTMGLGAEGLGAATHDGTTTEGNGAVGADGDGVGAADISYLATRSADAEKLRRSSSRDVECDSPRPVRKAVPERFATERTLGTVSMFTPAPSPRPRPQTSTSGSRASTSVQPRRRPRR